VTSVAPLPVPPSGFDYGDPESGQLIAMRPAEVEPAEYAEDVVSAVFTLVNPLLQELAGLESDRAAHDDPAADVTAKRQAWIRASMESLEKAVRSGARHLQDHQTFVETGRPAPRGRARRRR
jgi:hypothetical protein